MCLTRGQSHRSDDTPPDLDSFYFQMSLQSISHNRHFYLFSSGRSIKQSPAVDYEQSEISESGHQRTTITESATCFLLMVNLHFFTLLTYSASCGLCCFFVVLPAAPTATEEISDRNASEKEDGYHVNARQLQYPNSKVERFPVPEEKVPWEVGHIIIITCSPHILYWKRSLSHPRFNFQVQFISYMPRYYNVKESRDQVDG